MYTHLSVVNGVKTGHNKPLNWNFTILSLVLRVF